MGEDGPKFAVNDRVRIIMGIYTGLEGVVDRYLNHTYYVRPDVNPRMFLSATEDFLELVKPTPRVDPLKQGMSSEDLANYVDQFIREAQARVRGVGDEQYSQGTHQKFEAMHPDELFEWAQEEVQDIAVYAAMLDIRLRRIREALKSQL